MVWEGSIGDSGKVDAKFYSTLVEREAGEALKKRDTKSHLLERLWIEIS